MNESKKKIVTLTITHACNLQCSYCYEHHKTGDQMEFAIAKSIIDREIETITDEDEIEFDLFGGEPFIAFDMVKRITEYVNQKCANIPHIIFATTNGTLIHGTIKKWLYEHKECFACGLSLDGTKEMHNINRSQSYDNIDLDFFLKLYPEQGVKMTVSRETLPALADGVIDLHRKGFIVSCNLAYDIDWSSHENEKILERELDKLIEFYLANPEIEPCSMLEMGISNVGLVQDSVPRYCGAGLGMRTYDVDGQKYSCQFFMPLSVGNEKAKAALQIDFPDLSLPADCLDSKCRSCVVRSICPNCFGANYAATGSIYQRDDNMCRLTKIIMKARSYFRAKQWELGQLHGTEADIQATLRAIIRIQEELEV